MDDELTLVQANGVAVEAHRELLHDVPRQVAAAVRRHPSDRDGLDHHGAIAHHEQHQRT
jgi:hypothetical protein